jgi:peroxiredoxin
VNPLEESEPEKPKQEIAGSLKWFRENYIPVIAIVVIVILAFILISPLFTNMVGEEAPDFSVTGTEGENFTLSENSGKVILLDLMSTTCPACVSEMKHLKELFGRYSEDEVVIITIDVQRSDSNSDLRAFKSKYGDNWTFARDTSDVANKYNVNYTPTTVIIDKEGIIRYYGTGEQSEKTLVQEIENLL